ncbi:unnamed protein product [Ectocarpus sp. CCAP 1310/34]|nr:unnamed protein product [Ectocarpus sp. CCAP 1310/34]
MPGAFALLAADEQMARSLGGAVADIDDPALPDGLRCSFWLVARGFGQREGIDFFETFSPCPSVTSIRLLAALACELGLDLCHFDTEQAFVQSELQECVYIRLPQGCGALSGNIVRLRRSLYGLKQASRTWHKHLVRGMKCLGFEQCAADACVMRLIEEGIMAMVVVVHVDDIFSIGRKSWCEQFGRLERTYAENMVAKFGVTRNKETPMAVGVKLEEFDACEPDVDEPFRSLVGHLMWLANQTRPDILTAVRAVARYSYAPKSVHWKAALHILMYIRFTSAFGITFQRGTVGGVSLEKSVMLSSTEAEYAAMADGMKEAIFLRYLWSFIFPDGDVVCTVVKEDNVGALHLANNPATTPNSKHIIDIRHHFIRERVDRGEFKVVFVPSHLQHADFLTKPLHKEAFSVHRNFVMNL